MPAVPTSPKTIPVRRPAVAVRAAVLPIPEQDRGETRLSQYLQRHAAQSLAQLRRQLKDSERNARLDDGSVQRLGELLVTERLVSPEDVEQALQVQAGHPTRRLGDLLIERQVLSETALRYVLSKRTGVPAIDLNRYPVDVAATLLIPRLICFKHRLLPIGVLDGKLIVAIADPSQRQSLETGRFATRMEVQFVVADATLLDAVMARYLGRDVDLETVVSAAEAYGRAMGGEDETAPIDLGAPGKGEDRPVVRLVNGMLSDAIHRRASDLHLRPTPKGIDVMLRVDGQMIKARRLGRALMPTVVARIKVMARMDITERMLPQDGSARVMVDGVARDLRVSVIPTVKGESVVIRILNADSTLMSLDALGFQPDDLVHLRIALDRSSGMVLVTGPTGSGKSTTLYAALKEVQKRSVKIMTVEEPVEYHLEGAEQISVNHDIGYTFGKALRHILRHDPDVIMVGEIRDRETAQIALEASMTGHLVLSTLHTNSAAAAIPRLIDMGIEPFMVASTITAVIAQRLIRLNCASCSQPEEVPAEMRRALALQAEERFSRGVGCDECNDTGYVGRGVVYELLIMDDALREATHGASSSAQLERLAIERGMRPLTQQALELARVRRTSLAEVYRVRLN